MHHYQTNNETSEVVNAVDSSHKIIILELRNFLSLFTHIKFAAGDNAVFECEVEGVTNLTWLKDNRPLSDKLADRITITQENNVYRLEIKNVCETDSGTYTARAENDQGVSYSTAHLIVEKCKPSSIFH